MFSELMDSSSSNLSQKYCDRPSLKKDAILKTLPPSIDKAGLVKVPGGYIKELLRKTVPRSTNDIDEFKKYIFCFDKFRARKKTKTKRKTILSASEQRRQAIFKLDHQKTKFEAFLPVYELWRQYMQDILQLKEKLPSDLSGVYHRLIKADYHGCMLVVASSTCSNYVGLRGIVILETRNVFRLITKENKIKTIPKKSSVFCFELCGKIFKIYGNNFRFLPYDRTKLKYKPKSIVDVS